MPADALIDLRRAVESGETLEIDAALSHVVEAKDPQSITPLLLLLNETADDYGMWSIVHAAEQFEDRAYVLGFLNALPGLTSSSPYWARIVTTRVLNSDATRVELVRQLEQASPAVKHAAKQVCEEMNESDLSLVARTAGVLAAAEHDRSAPC